LGFTNYQSESNMKQFITIGLMCIGIYSMSAATGDGIQFEQSNWQEAFELAKKERKAVFVDAYAEWCGPCKRMAKNVFTNAEVAEFYNANFINLKLDMEKSENRSFRSKYPVSAYPTLYFIDFDGEVITKKVGGMDIEGFMSLGKSALGSIDRSGDFAAEYEKGNRDPELVYNYVRALNAAGKPSSKIANAYLRSQEDLTSSQNLKFILEAANDVDSYAFGLLEKYKSQVIAISSKEEVEAKVLAACDATRTKAVEFESADLLEEALNKMKIHCPDQAKMYALKANMQYAQDTGARAEHLKYCKKYAKTIADQPDELAKLATELGRVYKEDKTVSKLGEQLSAQAVKKGGKFFHYITYAQFLKRNGKLDAAQHAAEKSLELAVELQDRRAVNMAQKLLKILEDQA
ncbi:MAG: thioredoxin family protein, partial [Bacteroidota bacterium]